MKSIFNILFPWKLHMHMLQLEEYKLSRFLKWIAKHPLKRKLESKKPFIVTSKVKLLLGASIVWLGFFTIFFDPLIALIIATQPFILFVLAILAIKPYEKFNLMRTANRVNRKIKSLKKLTVIGIAGSYGKTSTKELLYQIMKDTYKTLRTPESYNTPFGIAKVVDLELDEHYDYFLCELGEYRKNEIKELAQMSQPSFGIITGITKQHFERFKSLKNIISTIFELSDFVRDQDHMVYNIDNEFIANEITKRALNPKWTYAVENKSAFVRAENISFTKIGTSLTLIIGDKKYNIKTPLFGYGQIVNLLGAICMSLQIKIPEKQILASLAFLSPAFNRSVIRTQGKATIIDNTYSSNIVGFMETIRTAKAIKGSKILITPGIVELGSEERKIHLDLGKKSIQAFDKIVLVGKNTRTLALFEGGEKDKKFQFIKDIREEYQNAFFRASENYSWVFLENDVTQNY